MYHTLYSGFKRLDVSVVQIFKFLSESKHCIKRAKLVSFVIVATFFIVRSMYISYCHGEVPPPSTSILYVLCEQHMPKPSLPPIASRSVSLVSNFLGLLPSSFSSSSISFFHLSCSVLLD